MDIWSTIARARESGTPAVVVTVTATRGSVPADAGAKAVVTAEGLLAGTVGGGKIEAHMIEEASRLLADRGESVLHFTRNLQRDIGMTCGGEMSFLLEKCGGEPDWSLVVFGAGHVSQALVPLLATLRARIDVIDTRGEWLDRLTQSPNLRLHPVESFEEGVRMVTDRSFVISLTKGHATDRPVLRDCLRAHPTLPYIGVIGSAAKRAVLMRELREDGLSEELLAKIECPLGLPIGTNEPAEIAISIAARLLQARDEWLSKDRENISSSAASS